MFEWPAIRSRVKDETSLHASPHFTIMDARFPVRGFQKERALSLVETGGSRSAAF
jgi:hypothetical protein